MRFFQRNFCVQLKVLFLHKKCNLTLVIFLAFLILYRYFIFLDLNARRSGAYFEFKHVDTQHAIIDKLNLASESLEEIHESHQSCKIPILTPGTDDIYELDYLQFETVGFGRPPLCFDNNSTMFAIDYESNLIKLNHNAEFWKEANCFYRSFQRDPDKPDISYIFRKRKQIFGKPQEKIKLSLAIENIRIWCKHTTSNNLIYEDYLSHVPVKPELETKLANSIASQNPEDYPSILIFGQDSTSHMNFRRYMPKSHEYLVNEMGGVEFNGFNSLGDGTLWSLFALFTGMGLREFEALCHQNETDYFDDCPMIWKDFQKLGYRTSYAEDAIHVGIFNNYPYPGFSKQPVDYDFRAVTKFLSSVFVGHNLSTLSAGCYGSRLTFDVLLENFVKTAHTFSKLNKPVWHFSWTSELTHNINYYSKYGEEVLLRALKQLHSGNLLNNTVLILLSDHGLRYGPMRQRTRQGFLEERLPILYIVLPESLKKRYPNAYENMKGNSNKLVTAFDLYSTMKDLMNLKDLEQKRLLERRAEVGLSNRRNVSLFLPINENRTCDMIAFSSIYCACMNRISVSLDSPLIKLVADVIVAEINANLTNHPECDQLTLDRVTTAVKLDTNISLSDENARFNENSIKKLVGRTYEIGFETSPGGGAFYASISQDADDSAIKITNINRISAYGKDADCIKIKELWPFCHCNNQFKTKSTPKSKVKSY